MLYKICNKCGDPKQLTEFYENKRTKDGLHGWCKSCCIEAAKLRQRKNKGRIALLRKRRRIVENVLKRGEE